MAVAEIYPEPEKLKRARSSVTEEHVSAERLLALGDDARALMLYRYVQRTSYCASGFRLFPEAAPQYPTHYFQKLEVLQITLPQAI